MEVINYNMTIFNFITKLRSDTIRLVIYDLFEDMLYNGAAYKLIGSDIYNMIKNYTICYFDFEDFITLYVTEDDRNE